MFKNFITIILVVGLIILISSNATEIWQWGQNKFKSEITESEINNQSEDKSVTLDKELKNQKELKLTENNNVVQEESTLSEQTKINLDDNIKGLNENVSNNKQFSEYTDEELKENQNNLAKKETDEQSTIEIIQGVVKKGDTIIELLEPYDNANRVKQFLNAAEDVFSPKRFRIGQPYVIQFDKENNNIKSFEYEIDKFKKLIIDGEEPKAKLEEIVYDKKLALVENTIEDNLFLAVTDIGENAQLAMRIADIFAWEINFIRDIQENDSFAILVEKLYRDGEFKGYGRAFGAFFTNKGDKYSAFLYYDAKKIEGYYSTKGESLKKVLLQSPLSFSRVTSGYTRSRKHPIFGDYRPHLGIDYGAPSGTPVMAVGDGTVKIRGWVGGYGYQVVLVHSSGFESMYSHLSRFPKNVRKGSKVRQGQVIGYVGSTGISTGPHLDFRLKRYGKFINPSSAMSPRAEPIAKKNKAEFDKWVAIVNDFMDKNRALDTYSTDILKLPK